MGLDFEVGGFTKNIRAVNVLGEKLEPAAGDFMVV